MVNSLLCADLVTHDPGVARSIPIGLSCPTRVLLEARQFEQVLAPLEVVLGSHEIADPVPRCHLDHVSMRKRNLAAIGVGKLEQLVRKPPCYLIVAAAGG